MGTIRVRSLLVIALGTFIALGIGTFPVQADGPIVITKNSVSWVEGSEPVQPAEGKPGVGNAGNWLPYFRPGETTQGNKVIGAPYYLAYANQDQPIQTTDWWSGVGLQWQGWVTPVDLQNPVVRTNAFVSEPFHYQFLDLPQSKQVPGLGLPVQGLRMWNQVDMRIFTGSENTATNLFGRGSIADERSPIVTVGLKDVHPISAKTPVMPTSAPWTNVVVQSYSDWGVVMSYASGGSELTMTMANGSPFTWFARTKGDAPFRVWAGGDTSDIGGDLQVWRNQNGVLGLTVITSYVPPGPQVKPNPLSKAAYAVFADKGNWNEQKSTNSEAHMSMFVNPQATKLVVAALPHNLDLNNVNALNAALTEFQQYAWNRIVKTQIHYPPIEGSQARVRIGGVSKPLGYDARESVLRMMMEVTTENFKTGAKGGKALQFVFPHHRKVMIPEDLQNILTVNNQPKYTWRSVKGELQAYVGNKYVRELTTYGLLPFLPSVAVNSTAQVNGKLPAEDVYQALKTWFFQAEPNDGGTPGSFVRNIGTYFPFQNNTYSPNLAGVFEPLFIADELSNSPNMTGMDSDRGKPKKQVANEMRAFILDSLKEMVGRWGDLYSAGYFQYNPQFDTIYGFPEGYGSVQKLADKHFHWGYFLRSAAAIGRYDPEWLKAYMPLFRQLREDVANYKRSNNRYPFLRNFSPFYGHSWADGVANESVGNNQESTSEAINFAVGAFELGQQLDDKEWRDIGLYLYEEEILGVEQYWFNQDANLDASSGTFYNGNWPDAFVHYQKDGSDFITTVVGQVFQTYVTRGTFFGAPGYPQFANSLLIQSLPLSASHLYIGRDQDWLMHVWQEFQRESKIDPGKTPYEVLLAGVQSRLPGSGTNIDDPGPLGAIARINRLHLIFPGAVNAQGKHWAYTLNELGIVDTSVVANFPSYGVFCKNANGANCAGGTRTFVAYNPTNKAVNVSFKDAKTNAVIATLNVPAFSEATKVGDGTRTIDTPTPAGKFPNRLYFLKPNSFPATCDALANGNLTLPLQQTAGTWKFPEGQSAYPQDTGALKDSIVCIPARPNTDGANVPPDAPYVRRWSGQFSGTLVKNDAKPHTRFAIFSDQSLFPGWELDPCVQGGKNVPGRCPSAGLNPPDGPGANAFTIQVAYDFNGDGKQDRIEQFRNVTLSIGNTFTYENKQTDYGFDQVFPYAPPPMVLGGPDGTRTKPFPDSIPADKPATITVTMWGGTITGGVKAQYPVPISVNADLLTNRASWIMAPYN